MTLFLTPPTCSLTLRSASPSLAVLRWLAYAGVALSAKFIRDPYDGRGKFCGAFFSVEKDRTMNKSKNNLRVRLCGVLDDYYEGGQYGALLWNRLFVRLSVHLSVRT